MTKRLEIFFMNLPATTQAVFRSDNESLYLGINQNHIESIIDLIENKGDVMIKAPD